MVKGFSYLILKGKNLLSNLRKLAIEMKILPFDYYYLLRETI